MNPGFEAALEVSTGELERLAISIPGLEAAARAAVVVDAAPVAVVSAGGATTFDFPPAIACYIPMGPAFEPAAGALVVAGNRSGPHEQDGERTLATSWATTDVCYPRPPVQSHVCCIPSF